jgi:hypothetical protein
MWENCVGCGEGLFAGDAFCGNCGRATAATAGPSTGPAQEQRATVAAGRAPQGGSGRRSVGAPPGGRGLPDGRGPQDGRGLPDGRVAPAGAAPDGRGPQAGATSPAGSGPVPAARIGEPGSGLIRIYAKPTPPTAPAAAGPGPAPDDALFPTASLPFPEEDAAFAGSAGVFGPGGMALVEDNTPVLEGDAPVLEGDAPVLEGDAPVLPPGPLFTSPAPTGGPAGAELIMPGALADQAILWPPGSADAVHGTAALREPEAGPDGLAGGHAQPVPAAGPPRTRLTGHGGFDPAGNNRVLLQLLRQAALFAAIYALIQTGTLLTFLALGISGLGLGPALGLEMVSLKVVALILVIPFWLIPVSALLGQWAVLTEGAAGGAKEAFQRMSAAFSAHGIPVDSLEVQTVTPGGEDTREYLEVRRGRFRGFLACFPHGRDLYLGWTFWLRISPARLLLLVIGRRLRNLGGRGDIERTLRAESARALVAAMHTAALTAAEDPALRPDDPPLLDGPGRDVSVRVG